MDVVFAELGTYAIKFVVFLILAICGFFAGTKWRKAKDEKAAKADMKAETKEEARK